jgi:hypothetical protein
MASRAWKWLQEGSVWALGVIVCLLLPLVIGTGIGIHTQPWLGLILGLATLIFGGMCILNIEIKFWHITSELRGAEAFFGMIFLVLGSGILLKVVEHSSSINASVTKLLGFFIR